MLFRSDGGPDGAGAMEAKSAAKAVPASAEEAPAAGLPVVVFLHGFSYQLGTGSEYGLYESSSQGGLLAAIAARGAARDAGRSDAAVPTPPPAVPHHAVNGELPVPEIVASLRSRFGNEG